MKRIIKDYKNITPELLDVLNSRYPEGIDEDDLISFTNHQNEKVKAVEVRYDDDIYLIKVSKQLTAKMDEALDGDDDDLDDDFESDVVEGLDDDDELKLKGEVEVEEEDDEDDDDRDDEDDGDDDEK